jgi:hypothetical protein
MALYYQLALMSASIFVAAIIGVVRFNKIDPTYYPVVCCIWIASLNEIISFTLIANGFTTTINNNVYVLIESILITLQFKNWGLFSNRPLAFKSIITVLLIVWITENYYGFTQQQIQYYFRLVYSCVIVLMGIHLNNNIVYSWQRNLLTSPVFQFCTGFIIYFTCKIVVEAFWLYGLDFSVRFLTNVYLILSWVNLAVNFIYSSALLCIPQKRKHTMLL